MNKKICHISLLYSPYFAGRAIYLEKNVFKIFSGKGVENIVITANFDDLPHEEIINGVIIHRLPLKKKGGKNILVFTLKSIIYLFKIRSHYQIIHMHGFWDIYGLLTLFGKIFRKKTILHMTLIGSDDPLAIIKSYKFMKLRFKWISQIDAFISISSPMSDNYRKTNLPSEKLYQIPNGVDTKVFSPDLSKSEKREIRKKMNMPVDGRIVVFVGAIIERKGVDLLIDAWIDVNKKIENSLLILIGPDTYDGIDGDIELFRRFGDEMKKIVNEKQLRIRFIGKSDKVSLLLKASDLLVLPSRSEGFGNVIIEAMATGLPVIISEMDGIAYDLIEPGQQGFVVRDVKELADRIICLLKNDEELIRMGRNSRERALEKFDLVNICDNYISLYEKLIRSGHGKKWKNHT